MSSPSFLAHDSAGVLSVPSSPDVLTKMPIFVDLGKRQELMPSLRHAAMMIRKVLVQQSSNQIIAVIG